MERKENLKQVRTMSSQRFRLSIRITPIKNLKDPKIKTFLNTELVFKHRN